MHFFALSVTTSLKIPGAVIPRRVFTRPGPLPVVVGAGRGRLLDRNWVGCRKCVLECVVECLFLVPARALGAIVIAFMSFAFRISIQVDFSDRGVKGFQSRANNPDRAYVP